MPLAFHLGSLLDVLATCICVDHLFFTVQEIRCWDQVVHIGSSGFYRVDQAFVLIYADVDFHLEVALVAFLGLMHLRITIPPQILFQTKARLSRL